MHRTFHTAGTIVSITTFGGWFFGATQRADGQLQTVACTIGFAVGKRAVKLVDVHVNVKRHADRIYDAIRTARLWINPMPVHYIASTYCCDTGYHRHVGVARNGREYLSIERNIDGSSDGPANAWPISKADYDTFVRDYAGTRD